jgi:hypothetical protein
MLDYFSRSWDLLSEKYFSMREGTHTRIHLCEMHIDRTQKVSITYCHPEYDSRDIPRKESMVAESE